MSFSDITFILKWWLVLFAIGIIFLPLTSVIFKNFFDKGYIFSKILGMALISYVVFVLGILKILPFTELTILLVVFSFLIPNILISKYFQKITSEEPIQSPRRWPAGLLRGGRWKIFLFEEIIFLAAIFFWSYIRAHQPDIHGLEKYMDFGFVNSIIRSEHFPPKDMWFTPHSINYYYFGHLVTAVLTKLSGIPSSITYNLMLSTIFALTFTASFSIGASLLEKFKVQSSKFKVVAAGLLTGFLVSMAGNLHTVYAFFKPYANENPIPFWQLLFSPQTLPNSYWYPNATRFIHNTIHEFPIYSFVVSDLHGHFLDIPFVLFTIAVLFSLLISKFEYRNPKQYQMTEIQNSKRFGHLDFENLNLFRASNFGFRILLLAFLLAIMYMTNAWDGIIYFLLAAIILLFLCMRLDQPSPMEIKNEKLKIKNSLKIENYKLKIARWLFYISIVIVGSILFSLPFSLSFKPFASGIGILCSPEFLTNVGKMGPLLFEKDHCLRSPIWQLTILYGFFYFWIFSFVVMIFKIKNSREAGSGSARQKLKSFKNLNFIENFKLKIENLTPSDLFVLTLTFLSTLLIIIPEFIYIKDIYPGHYRANTMFKLVYQAFMMLSIASGYVVVRTISNIKYQISNIFNFYFVFFIFSILFFILVMIYPYFAINSYYNLKTYQGLDGIKYLKTLYPTDYEGILWINKNIKGQPVILEAQGDSYTDYARVSSNTGLPTVLGWTVHEWLWRGTYDIPSPRIPEVQTLYETQNLEDTKKLIDKYKIRLVFVGDLERKKYPKLNEENFKNLGKVIYQNGNTKIYKIFF